MTHDMHERVVEHLVAIVRGITRSKSAISESALIYDDLLIAGDDAWELLTKVTAEFGTSFDGFEFAEYFPAETEAFWEHLGKMFRLSRRPRKRLSVQHLVQVIERGSWFEPHHDGN